MKKLKKMLINFLLQLKVPTTTDAELVAATRDSLRISTTDIGVALLWRWGDSIFPKDQAAVRINDLGKLWRMLIRNSLIENGLVDDEENIEKVYAAWHKAAIMKNGEGTRIFGRVSASRSSFPN